LVTLGGNTGVAHLATGVDEGNELGGVLFEGFVGDLVAMLEQGVQKMQDGDFTADAFELGGVDLGTLAEEIGGGLGLGAGAFVDELGFTVVLEPAETPVADIIFVEVFAGFAEAFDDGFEGTPSSSMRLIWWRSSAGRRATLPLRRERDWQDWSSVARA
jgi:hypothetical protein